MFVRAARDVGAFRRFVWVSTLRSAACDQIGRGVDVRRCLDSVAAEIPVAGSRRAGKNHSSWLNQTAKQEQLMVGGRSSNWMNVVQRALSKLALTTIVVLIIHSLNHGFAAMFNWILIPAVIGCWVAEIVVHLFFFNWIQAAVERHREAILASLLIPPISFVIVYLMVASTVLVSVEWVPSLAESLGASESIQVTVSMLTMLLIAFGWLSLFRAVDRWADKRLRRAGVYAQ